MPRHAPLSRAQQFGIGASRARASDAGAPKPRAPQRRRAAAASASCRARPARTCHMRKPGVDRGAQCFDARCDAFGGPARKFGGERSARRVAARAQRVERRDTAPPRRRGASGGSRPPRRRGGRRESSSQHQSRGTRVPSFANERAAARASAARTAARSNTPLRPAIAAIASRTGAKSSTATSGRAAQATA